MFPTLPTTSEFFQTEMMNGDHSQFHQWTHSASSDPLNLVPSSTWPDRYISKLNHLKVNLDTNNAVPGSSTLRRKPVPAPGYQSPECTPPASPVSYSQIPNNLVVNRSLAPTNLLPTSTRPLVPASKTPPLTTKPDNLAAVPVKCCEIGLKDVQVELENRELWAKFNEVGNEMLVTRSGRLMFPHPSFKLSGLSCDYKYKVAVKFVFADDYRYRFSPGKTSWKPLFRDDADYVDLSRYYEHSMSPDSGDLLGMWPLSFKAIKLCNSTENAKPNNTVYLPAMRKYRIQLVVTRLRCAQCKESHVRHIDVPLSDFITVTWYNNHALKQLKIENNPRARYLLDDEIKNGITLSSKGRKRANNTTRTSKKRKREDVLATSPTPEQNTEQSPKLVCYWSQQIEASPLNALPGCSDKTSYNIDVSNTATASDSSALETTPQLSRYYDNPRGDELELAFLQSTKQETFSDFPEVSYQPYQSVSSVPYYCRNLYGPYNYTLNYDGYYGCVEKQLQHSNCHSWV